MILLPSGVLVTNDAVSRVFSWENPDSGMRVLVGETGWEEMQDVREIDDKSGN